jgi:hypothetical protein
MVDFNADLDDKVYKRLAAESEQAFADARELLAKHGG